MKLKFARNAFGYVDFKIFDKMEFKNAFLCLAFADQVTYDYVTFYQISFAVINCRK